MSRISIVILIYHRYKSIRILCIIQGIIGMYWIFYFNAVRTKKNMYIIPACTWAGTTQFDLSFAYRPLKIQAWIEEWLWLKSCKECWRKTLFPTLKCHQYTFLLWKWKQQCPLKHWYLATELHSVTSRKIAILMKPFVSFWSIWYFILHLASIRVVQRSSNRHEIQTSVANSVLNLSFRDH
jgi:hypothetical protein